ncbi:hypothetical protein CLOP_g13372 [Closterium sp. NIES-67]|nr:hypothetical protein CLOP_g13372 [Closterium sp. NIES-67]
MEDGKEAAARPENGSGLPPNLPVPFDSTQKASGVSSNLPHLPPPASRGFEPPRDPSKILTAQDIPSQIETTPISTPGSVPGGHVIGNIPGGGPGISGTHGSSFPGQGGVEGSGPSTPGPPAALIGGVGGSSGMETTPQRTPPGRGSDTKAFVKELQAFFETRHQEFKVPKFYGVEVDLLKLWQVVCSFGGFDKVTSGKLWRVVGDQFDPPKSCTTLSWSFRGFYEKALLEYERHVGVDPMLEGTLAITPRSDAKHHGGQEGGSGPRGAKRVAAAKTGAGDGDHTDTPKERGTPGSGPKRHRRNQDGEEAPEGTPGSAARAADAPRPRGRPPGSGAGTPGGGGTSGREGGRRTAGEGGAGRVEGRGGAGGGGVGGGVGGGAGAGGGAGGGVGPGMDDGAVAVVNDLGLPADWVRINVRRSPDCFEIYALVPGLLREEVRVQCEPAGKLVIAGEPEQPDNPWGVTPFKKVILLPAAINANQTSAVVTLHGQLYVRAPLAHPGPPALSPQMTPIPAPDLPPPPLPQMGGGQGQGGQGQGNQGQMGQGQGGQVQGQGQQGVVSHGQTHSHGHGHVKQQSPPQAHQQQTHKEQGQTGARAMPQQHPLAAAHAAPLQQQQQQQQLVQQAQPQVPFQVQSQVQAAQQQQQQPPRPERSADVDMAGNYGGEGLRDGGREGNASVNKPMESQNGVAQQLQQQAQQGKQGEREAGTNEMAVGMAVTAAS